MFNIPYFYPRQDIGVQINNPGIGGPGGRGHGIQPRTDIRLSQFFIATANFEGVVRKPGVPTFNNRFSGQINGTTINGLQKR